MKSHFQHSLSALSLLAFSTVAAVGQDYSFRVPTLQMHAVIQADASVKLVYDITFQNTPEGRAIDIVDIGVPHKDYRLGNVSASIDGRNLSNIRHSDYVSPGFEVHLDAGTLVRGQRGTLHVEFIMPNMVYQDTTRADYASFRITPTWFGSKYVTGLTNIQVAVHLPKGIERDEILHQGLAFSDVIKTKDGFSVVWQMHGQRLDGPHMVAISFPKRGLDRVVHITHWQLLARWFGGATIARIVAAILALVLAGNAYSRFTGGTGSCLFLVLALGCGIWFLFNPTAHLVSLPVLAALLGVNEYFLRRRKSTYLPPIVEIEGGGIKRGLTAPEAAILLELPIGRVLGLVVFGMLKKGILREINSDPLIVELHEGFANGKGNANQKDRSRQYRKAARESGTVIHGYETGFLLLLEENVGKPIAEIDFTIPMQVLIINTAGKMRAFDLSDTQDYYRSIVRRAVNQARNVGDIRQIDKNFEWIMIDDESPSVFESRNYSPSWHHSTRHSHSSTTPPSTTEPKTTSAGGSTTLGDVGASFAGWSENMMDSCASSLSPSSLNPARAKSGFTDLSGMDRKVDDFFEAISDSRGSSSGGGGGCACAGCACACACAGGGR